MDVAVLKLTDRCLLIEIEGICDGMSGQGVNVLFKEGIHMPFPNTHTHICIPAHVHVYLEM